VSPSGGRFLRPLAVILAVAAAMAVYAAVVNDGGDGGGSMPGILESAAETDQPSSPDSGAPAHRLGSIDAPTPEFLARLTGRTGVAPVAVGGPDGAVFGTHVVRAGETLWEISREYRVSVRTIVLANDLSDPDLIVVGQRLTIPPADGVVHTVRRGETIWEISRAYGVEMAEVIGSNPGVRPDRLQVGQKLFVPGARVQTAAGSRAAGDSAFSWPVEGRISSYFGYRWGRLHTGIDIAAPLGSPIRASRAGTVIASGWMGGYGRTVVLKHGDGSKTLYAHASSLLVHKGQRVERGRVIARVGSSGHSTGPHVHFEVIIDGKPRDPLNYLQNR